jgi:hypothetical protein
MRRLHHLPDLWTARGLHDHAVSPIKLKSGGVKVIDLAAASENDPYNIGH